MDSDVGTEDDDRGAVGHAGNDVITKRDQRDSEQREIDEFEEEERKIFALESQVRNFLNVLFKPQQISYQYLEFLLDMQIKRWCGFSYFPFWCSNFSRLNLLKKIIVQLFK